MASRYDQSNSELSDATQFTRLINEINIKFDTLIQSLADRKLTLVREVQSLQTEHDIQKKKRQKSIQELEMVIRESKSLELENNLAIQKRADFLKGIELELSQLKLNSDTAKLELELDIITLQDTIASMGQLTSVTLVSIPTPVDYTKKINPVKSVGKRGEGPCEFNSPLEFMYQTVLTVECKSYLWN